MSWAYLPDNLKKQISSEISTESKFRAKPNKKIGVKSEKQIQAEIVAYLDNLNYFYWRKNVGGVKYNNSDGSERYVSFGVKGESDLAVLLLGVFVAIEVKTVEEHLFIKKNFAKLLTGGMKMNKKNIHILEQINYLQNVRDLGHVGEFVSSVDEVINILESAKKC